MNKETIIFDNIRIHPGSSGHGGVLFFYNGELLRAASSEVCCKIKNIMSPPVPIQKSIETNYILSHPKHGNLPVFKHHFYDHVVKINESVPCRAVEFIKTICDINEYLLDFDYILCDVHEGNIADTIDGIIWFDIGSIYSINKPEERKNPAQAGLALTLYLANKYIYKSVKCNHELYSLKEAKNTKTPLKEIASLSGSDKETWRKLKSIVENAKVSNGPNSHWSDEYATNASHENLDESSRKGKAVLELINMIEYDTLTDVACNKGYFTFYAAKKAKSSIGLDIDEKCISIAINKKPKDINVVFSKKDIKDLIKNNRHEDLRYSSDLILALAIVHHMQKIMPHKDFVKLLANLSKKYIIVEDVDTRVFYEEELKKYGFNLVKRVTSFPASRTISLYSK